ncbi:unnamed protein product [Notodromas monacha]|nr:unnamed protein product [Notodromas monacha]CAG0923380.1 unnamed protein product [Notodromas monacha]
MTFLVLACALPQHNWWPFFVVMFYIASPFPVLISRRYSDGSSSSSACHEFAVFLTTGIVISAFSLPVVLARAPSLAPVITWGSCGLILAANIVMFLTIVGFFIAFNSEDLSYNMW